MEQLPKTDPRCRTLGFAVLGRIVRLKIPDDFLRAVVGNSRTKSLLHLVYFGFPGRCRQWRLHCDVGRAVASVAVNPHLLAAIPGD